VTFVFDERASDSPWVEMVWRTQSQGGGSFMSAAASHVEMVVTRQPGGIHFTVRGPETKASPAPIPEDAEFLGIIFRLGTFTPCLPVGALVDGGIHLPTASSQSFWLHGSAWSFPDFDNADTFVERLVRQGLLAHEPVVEAALAGAVTDLSVRSVQRRFLRATGITPVTMQQIERARRAMHLLQQGVPILDVADQTGYYDQPHLTRALKHFIGQTPAQIADARSGE
jgi:AraC-like DNA-binding protein